MPPRVVSLKLWRWQEDNSVQVCDFENFSFLPYTARFSGIPQQQVLFHARTIVNRTQRGKRQTVKLDDNNWGYCHTYVQAPLPGSTACLACTVVASADYPMRIAYSLIHEAMELFTRQYSQPEAWQKHNQDTKMDFPAGQELFDKFQDPDQADKVAKIEKELEEVKSLVVKSLDDVLRRGEKLEDLEEKSKDVGQAAIQFRRQAEKQNSCCAQYM